MADLNSKIESAKEKVRWCRVLDRSLGGLLASNRCRCGYLFGFSGIGAPEAGSSSV